MMPVIRISDTTWDAMKEWAVPLEDSADDVVQKLIEIAREHNECATQTQSPSQVKDGDSSTNIKRLPKGLKVREEEYFAPILESLYEMGGKGRVSSVLIAVEQKMKHLLGEFDYEPLPKSRDLRWRNTTMFARKRLIDNGSLRHDSERGVWELSQEGIDAVEGKRA